MELRAWSGFGFEHLGEPVAHDAGVGPGEGEGGSEPEVSQPVAVAALHALDEPMQTESPEVVGHPARGDVAGIDPQQWSDILPQIAIGKPAGLETEDHQGGQQLLHALVVEAKSRDPPTVHLEGSSHLAGSVLTDSAVVGQSLDVQETSVGLEADLAQHREVLEPPADGEVSGVVDGRLGPQRPPFLMMLLDVGALVVEVERGDDAVGDDAGAEAARRPPRAFEVCDEGVEVFDEGEVLATADPLVEDDGALLVEDAEVEGSGMEVDAAVVQVLLLIESYGPLLGVMWNRNQHPLKTTTIVSNVFAANRWRKAT